MRRWWCKKYKLPQTDPRFGEHTEEMLLLEMFEDLWEDAPHKARAMLGGYEDDVALETDDPEIAEIERRLKAGEDPDEVFKDWGEGAGNNEPDAFDDKYDEEDEPTSMNEGLSWAPKE